MLCSATLNNQTDSHSNTYMKRETERQKSMSVSTQTHPHLPWISIFIFSTFLFSFTLSDPRATEAELYCGTNKPPPGINFISMFINEFEQLSHAFPTRQFATHSIVSNNSRSSIYGLAQCHHDLSQTDCLLCLTVCRTRLPRCLPFMSGTIYMDGCFLRYDNYSFHNESTDPIRDKVNCSSSSGEALVVGEDGNSEFSGIVHHVLDNVTETAVLNGGFGVAEVGGVYALAQCWNTVSSDGCRSCLEKAGNGVRKCAPNKEGRGLNAGCYLRYSTHKFYGQNNKRKSSSGFFNTGIAVGIVLCTAAFLMLALFAAYARYARLSKSKEGLPNLRLVSLSIKKSNLNYKYETLEKATNYFSPSRKLGQGGSGSVYKATLPHGEIVAVKRLVFNTRQWVDEFFNEVNLISDIQHKNLVKLLGCSIEGPESLLVYEYVTNKSLDQFIFDKNKGQVLNWKQRLHIIVGTAEGLAYLHGGSETRIIHRDIKSSNVLLDENLNPKIADFGLVRCFADDQSHLSTGIAGTLGYMAPEYLVRGQLTEKADVYSFGVLLLEIVCGRRNNVFTEDSISALQMVWRLYSLNRLSESVDPRLKDDFPVQETSNVLQIGLLCTQASVALRPSMEEVVHMLTHENCEIPIPKQPPFMNSNVLYPASSGKSYSINSLESNAERKIGMSYTSSESYTMHSSEGPSKSEELVHNLST